MPRVPVPVLHRRVRTTGVRAGELPVLSLHVWLFPDLLLPARQGAVLRQLGAHRRDGKRSRVARHREEGIRQHWQRQSARHRLRAVRARDGLKGPSSRRCGMYQATWTGPNENKNKKPQDAREDENSRFPLSTVFFEITSSRNRRVVNGKTRLKIFYNYVPRVRM